MIIQFVYLNLTDFYPSASSFKIIFKYESWAFFALDHTCKSLCLSDVEKGSANKTVTRVVSKCETQSSAECETPKHENTHSPKRFI